MAPEVGPSILFQACVGQRRSKIDSEQNRIKQQIRVFSLRVSHWALRFCCLVPPSAFFWFPTPPFFSFPPPRGFFGSPHTPDPPPPPRSVFVRPQRGAEAALRDGAELGRWAASARESHGTRRTSFQGTAGFHPGKGGISLANSSPLFLESQLSVVQCLDLTSWWRIRQQDPYAGRCWRPSCGVRLRIRISDPY